MENNMSGMTDPMIVDHVRLDYLSRRDICKTLSSKNERKSNGYLAEVCEHGECQNCRSVVRLFLFIVFLRYCLEGT